MRTRLALLVCSLALVAPAHAQVRIDAGTEVRKIRFQGANAIPERKLRGQLKTRDRGGSYGLRVALGKLPFVPGPGAQPFAPLVLQQDVVRLRQTYVAAGFFGATVRYDVARDDARNLLDVTFVIEEGRPTVLTNVAIRPADTTRALPIAERDRGSWRRLERSLLRPRGKPLEIDNATAGRDRLRSWWRDRGYPLADVAIRPHTDTTRAEASLVYRVATGTFARFGELDVQGTKALEPGTVRRLAPIDPGAPYSAKALEDTRLAVRRLEVVRTVDVSVPALAGLDTATAALDPGTVARTAQGDSLLPVRVQITEGERRQIGGDLGYVTDGGISSELSWDLRDFSGGGRSLKLTATAQTGWWATADNPDKRYRMALALNHPGFLRRDFAGILAPFVEYRDDSQDRSTQYGVNATVVKQVSQFQSVSLNYQIADRKIHEYRAGDLASGEIDLLTFLTQAAQGALDSLGSTVASSLFTLSGITGSLDNAANPRAGFIARPALQVTAPTAWSSTAFWRVDVSANGFVPVSRRVTLMGRAAFGRLFPFGKSIPDPGEDPTKKFLQLRDVMFTAGGTGDVRGWENRLLGPKVPDVRFTQEGDSLVPHADGYVPFGGLARLSFSLELQLPLPGFGPSFGSHLFFDGGRVSTADGRFDLDQAAHGQQAMFYATGAGIDWRTPVGPIKAGFGYKLNPSLTDLVDAAELLRAAADNRPLDSLPRDQSRRWQFYLSIGASY